MTLTRVFRCRLTLYASVSFVRRAGRPRPGLAGRSGPADARPSPAIPRWPFPPGSQTLPSRRWETPAAYALTPWFLDVAAHAHFSLGPQSLNSSHILRPDRSPGGRGSPHPFLPPGLGAAPPLPAVTNPASPRDRPARCPTRRGVHPPGTAGPCPSFHSPRPCWVPSWGGLDPDPRGGGITPVSAGLPPACLDPRVPL